MTDERLILAIGRLERALSRIESRGFPPPADDQRLSDLQRRYDKLDERHHKLRARTNEAVDQLGLLLETPKSA